MNLGERQAYENAVTEALRMANDALGDEQPTQQVLRVLEAVRSLRSDKPVVNPSTERIDYMERAVARARMEWSKAPAGESGARRGIGGTDTPMGRLKAVTWRRDVISRPGKEFWHTEYYLDDQPISLREIREAGLARRPTIRRRPKQEKRA